MSRPSSADRPLLLVLRALGLGDFCTGVPALRAIRRAYPGHEIALAAPAVLRPLVEASGAVDRIVDVPAYVREPVRTVPPVAPPDVGPPHVGPPDVTVNLHGRGPESHRALLALSPGRLLAFACQSAGVPHGPQWIADEHEVARWCRMLDWYGHPADPADLALPAPPPRRVGAVVIHPGASGEERCWPVERFAATARLLAGAGEQVVVTGSAAERERALAVARAGGLPEESVLAGRTTLEELASVVAHARVVACGDTGVAHLATAYGTPSVVLFGPVSPAHWGPPPDRPRHRALWRGPHGLTAITVDDVVEAAMAATTTATAATAAGAGHAAAAR